MLYEVRIWTRENGKTGSRLYKALFTEQEAHAVRNQLVKNGVPAFVELSVNLERRRAAGLLK